MMFIAVSDNQQFGATSRSEVERWAAQNVVEGRSRDVWVWMFEDKSRVSGHPVNSTLVGRFVKPEAA
jgi:hypothetical protein